MRAETGAMRFGEDWQGVFIRGDAALYYAIQLKKLRTGLPDKVPKDLQLHGVVQTMEDLIELLDSCMETCSRLQGVDVAVDDLGKTQKLKPFEECLK